MKRVLLDTNFLLLPITMKVDIFSEIARLMDEPYELCILDDTIIELGKIIDEQRGKAKEAAGLALKLINAKNIRVVRAEKQKSLYMNHNSKELAVDDIIVSIADADTIVATQDRGLKKRLFEKGVNTIILRGKKKLEFGCYVNVL